MKMTSYKIPYDAIAHARMTLEDMGLETRDTGACGLQTFTEKRDGGGRDVAAMIKVFSFGNCLVMIDHNRALDFVERCDVAEPMRY